MPDVHIKFRCHKSDCRVVTEVTFPVSGPQTGETKRIAVYCSKHHPNLITVDTSYGEASHVLGPHGLLVFSGPDRRFPNFIRHDGRLPLVQGEEP